MLCGILYLPLRSNLGIKNNLTSFETNSTKRTNTCIHVCSCTQLTIKPVKQVKDVHKNVLH